MIDNLKIGNLSTLNESLLLDAGFSQWVLISHCKYKPRQFFFACEQEYSKLQFIRNL